LLTIHNESDMPDYPTIPAIVAHGLDKNQDIACSTKRGGEWIATSAAAFQKQTSDFARGLYALGMRKGDRIALHAENSTEWLIVDQAALSLGAVTVPIYTTQPGDQIRYIVDNAGARLYIVSTQALFDACPPDLKTVPSLEYVIGIFGPFGDLSYADVLARGQGALDFVPPEVTSDDLATLVYTSGTTGVPKGVMLSHGNITSNMLAVAECLPFTPPITALSYLPLSHCFERIASIAYLYLGCPIYFVEDFLEIKDDIQTVRPHHMTTVPRLLEKVHAGLNQLAKSTKGLKGALLRWAMRLAEAYDVEAGKGPAGHGLAEKLVYKKIRENFGGNLRYFTSGGAALSPAIQAFFNGLGIMCGQGYGLTETSPVITCYTRDNIRPRSVGTCIRDVEVKIADDGEILARGPNIMQGYYKMPEKTAAVITKDGWFHTGDIGHLDSDGHLYITDRKKQLFKLSTGKYIAPTPIEISLCNSPLIEQAVVLGPGRRYCSALITVDAAALAKETGPADSDSIHPKVIARIQAIVDGVNESLPPWEQVKKFCILEAPFSIEAGELTPTMKVKRTVVQEKYHEQIERLYAAPQKAS